MSRTIPALRSDLDVMPSPVEEQPGILIRDPFRYSDATVIVPPLLAQGLAFFDGDHEELDLQAFLTQRTGDLQAGGLGRHLIETLDKCGFLESEAFFELREKRRREFAQAPERAPAHAGSGYAGEAADLREQLLGWGASPAAERSADGLLGIAAPHVSPIGGHRSYAAAYNCLHAGMAEKTFVILGTSHYGEPEKFGLTRKKFLTPFGDLRCATEIVDELQREGGDAVEMEDYCHSSEHSIEFQCVYLQHALGKADLKVVPILCGPLVESLLTGRAPDENESVRRFVGALEELAQKRRGDLVWVLGIDLAHIGRRYGDQFAVRSEAGPMVEVRRRDEERLARISAGDHRGFYELVRPNRDDLRWCGYSPVYCFLRAVEGARGEVVSYEQWNIDEQSVVSFTGMRFREEVPGPVEGGPQGLDSRGG